MGGVVTCPPDDKVRAFHHGRLNEAEMLQVLEHAEACSTCADRLNLLGDTADSLVTRLKRSVERSSFAEEQNCRAMELAALELEETISRDKRSTADPEEPITTPMLLGPYELQTRIDGGGMGDVYQAWHTKLKKPVALKLLTPERARQPAAIARFQREMEAGGLVSDHPNVVRATDADEDRGIHYLAMDLIPGRDLSDLARCAGVISIADACELMRQAAIGLAHLHQNGVIHRDFKPSNVMVTRDGTVKILDLGLAILPRDQLFTDDTLTDAWTVMGTADYMAPEQIFDSHRVTPAADLYSLGCSLFRLLTGRAPFEEAQYSTRPQKFKAHAMVDPPRLSKFRPDAPPELTELVGKLLAKTPSDRGNDAMQVALELARFGAGADIPALMKECDVAAASAQKLFQETPPNPVAPTAAMRRPRKKPRLRPIVAAALLGVAILFIGGGIAIRGVPWDRKPIETDEPIEPNQWYSAFRHDPTPLVWDNRIAGSDFKLDSERRILNVAYHGNVAMLGCGAIHGDHGFTLDVGIRPVSDWGQPLGIFFGYKQWEQNGDRYYQCQVIRLVPYHLEKNRNAAFRLERAKIVTRNQLPRTITLGSSEIIPWPPKMEVRLSMSYSRTQRGIIEVKWGELNAANLAKADANALLNHDDYVGQFGIWQHNNAVTYYDYRFSLTSEKDDP